MLEAHFEIFATKDKYKFDEQYESIKKLIDNDNPWLCKNLCLSLIKILESSERSQKKYVYKTLNYIIKSHQIQITSILSILIPIVTSDINSTIKEVKDSSMKCLKQLLKCSNNSDLEPFIPVILDAFTNPNTINSSVEKLASCVFVENVEAPALSIVTPILIKGLNERKTETKRKCCVIIDNMCKLVEHPKEIMHFGNLLESLIQKCCDTISDPEARDVANKSLSTLRSSLKGYNKDEYKLTLSIDELTSIINDINQEYNISNNDLLYVLQNMIELQYFKKEEWFKI